MKKMFFKILASLSAISAAIFPLTALGATLYFDAPTSSVPVGSSFPVKVLLETDQPVNAYAIRVVYAGSGLRYDGSNNANSIITVWQSTPAAAGNTVAFAGGSFAPFEGADGKLMMLNFTAVTTGTAQLAFANASVYLANGKGTKIIPTIKSATITVVSPGTAATQRLLAPSLDITPPLIAYRSYIPDPFNPAQKLFGFLVEDAGSGIKETDLRYRSGFAWSAWRAVANPAPLPTNVWEASLKVIDNAGNVSEAVLYDWAAFARFCLTWIIAVLVVVVFLIALVNMVK